MELAGSQNISGSLPVPPATVTCTCLRFSIALLVRADCFGGSQEVFCRPLGLLPPRLVVSEESFAVLGQSLQVRTAEAVRGGGQLGHVHSFQRRRQASQVLV